MKTILCTLTLLKIIGPGFTGDRESGKRHENVHQPINSSMIFISDSNRTILDAYHATNPYLKGHDKRMAKKLHDPDPKTLRQRAVYFIENLCREWYQITGLNEKQTRALLDKIYLQTKKNTPDIEARMCRRLLESYPDMRVVEPEIIRSIVHDWHKSLEKAKTVEGRIRSREEEADLVYLYNKVKSEKGNIGEQLARKWKEFRPHLSKYTKQGLLDEAKDLSGAYPGFSPEEMEAAKMRYEEFFRFKDEEKRISWTEEQAVDILYLYTKYKKNELNGKTMDNYWQIMHPELAFAKRKDLTNKISKLKRKKFKEDLTPEEEAAAESRLKDALARKKQRNQDTMSVRKGKQSELGSLEKENFIQQTPDSNTKSSRAHSKYDVEDEDWNYLQNLFREDASTHLSPPRPHSSYHYDSDNLTTLNQLPSEIFPSHFGSHTHPYTANPYYESGSSSFPHYNPNPTNPYYEHGSSSHFHYDPHTTYPDYGHGNSSHPPDNPHSR